MEIYIGLIMPSAFTYNTQGLLKCDGSLLPLNQYQALYAVIGSVYGGDARTTFGVPNLQGRVPMGMGTNPNSGASYIPGQFGNGQFQLSTANMPANLQLTGTATTTINAVANPQNNAVANPVGNVFASGMTGGTSPAPVKGYVNPSGETLAAMSTQAATTTITVGAAGGASAPITAIPPFVTINYFIVTLGLFPSRN